MSFYRRNVESGTEVPLKNAIDLAIGFTPRPEKYEAFPLPSIKDVSGTTYTVISQHSVREEGTQTPLIREGKINGVWSKDSKEIIVWRSDPIRVRFAEAFKRKLPAAATVFSTLLGSRE